MEILELKNTVTEIKNSVDELNIRTGIEETVNQKTEQQNYLI